MITYKFKPGDIVKLKSGGPLMTVSEQSHPSIRNADPKERAEMIKILHQTDYDFSNEFNMIRPDYDCQWFDDQRKLEKAVFSEEVLELFTPIDPATLVGAG